MKFQICMNFQQKFNFNKGLAMTVKPLDIPKFSQGPKYEVSQYSIVDHPSFYPTSQGQ